MIEEEERKVRYYFWRYLLVHGCENSKELK